MLTEKEIAQYEQSIREAGLQAEDQKVRNTQLEQDRMQDNSSMIKEQLDLTQEKQELYYQLRGFTLLPDESGELVWTQDKNNDLSFLTEAGINYCFWFLLGYLNKNILLGNYDEHQIAAKMEDIGVILNDTLFSKSNKYFREPTLEECKNEITRNIQKKIDLRKFANELIGLNISDAEIKQRILKEMEGTIEEELDKIRIRLMNERYRMMNSLVIWMLDQIHGAYQRAFKGMERKSLREHMHISETKGGLSVPERKGSSFLDKFK